MKNKYKLIHHFIFYFILYFWFFNKFQNIINCNSDSLIKKLKTKINFSNIDNKITAFQLEANAPCEDKYFINEIMLSNKKGYIMSIFDGHGGWVLSQYVNLLLYPYFIEAYYSKTNLELNEENKIIYSLNISLNRIEEEFKLISFLKYFEGNKKFKNFGTCALISIIIDKKLYTANLGDSKARLFIKEKNNTNTRIDYRYKYKKVSKVFNCRKKEEQKKLREKWPNIENIYKCKREKVCYVKGRLQPTSSLGDFYLKNVFYSLNLKKIDNDRYIEKELKNYEGPFIESIPDIKIFNLEEKDKYLIIGSDGLWDYLNSKEISKLINDFIQDKNKEFEENKIFHNTDKIGFGLLKEVIQKSAKKHNLKVLALLDIPLGKKLRRIHDDITIIICDLSKIYE